MNVIGGADLGIAQVNEVIQEISKRFASREDIVFGAVIDAGRRDSIEICVLAKAELQATGGVEPVEQSVDALAAAAAPVTMETLGLETEIARDDKPPRAVHKSKLLRRRTHSLIRMNSASSIQTGSAATLIRPTATSTTTRIWMSRLICAVVSK